MGINDLSRASQQKRFKEHRLIQRDAGKQITYTEDPDGNRRYDSPTTQRVRSLNGLTGAVNIVSADGNITVSVDGQNIEIGGGGFDLPVFMDVVDTPTAEGIAVFDDPPTNSNMVALIGSKDDFDSIYLENTSAEFRKGVLEDVSAYDDGLKLLTGQSVDFSNQPPGLPPSGWTERWNTSGSTFSVQEVVDTEGGKVLRHTGTNDGRRLLSYNSLDNSTDVELLVKMRRSGGSTWIVARASGESNLENAYFVSIVSSTIFLRKYINGALHDIGEYTADHTLNAWYWVRFRIQGDELYVKRWLAAGEEPEQWDIVAVDSDLQRGWFGVGGFAEDAKEWDVFNFTFPNFIGHGNRVALPLDLTELGTNPGMAIRWEEDLPLDTNILIETAAKGEVYYTDEPLGLGQTTVAEDKYTTNNSTVGDFTVSFQVFKALVTTRVSHILYRSRGTGTHTVSFKDDNGNELATGSGSGVATGDWLEIELNALVPITENELYRLDFTQPENTVLYSQDGVLYNGSLWQSIGAGITQLADRTLAVGLVAKTIKNTFHLGQYPVERLDDIVIKVDGVPTEEFTRPDETDPRKVVFNWGHEPPEDAPVTANYTGVEYPDETAEKQTLYLGGATGGTYQLGVPGDMRTLGHNSHNEERIYQEELEFDALALTFNNTSDNFSCLVDTSEKYVEDASIRIKTEGTGNAGYGEVVLQSVDLTLIDTMLFWVKGEQWHDNWGYPEVYIGSDKVWTLVPESATDFEDWFRVAISASTYTGTHNIIFRFTSPSGTAGSNRIVWFDNIQLKADFKNLFDELFGSGLVEIEENTDFVFTFSVRVRESSLAADFDGLTGAANPSLTITTPYDLGDWEEQTKWENISNIPAGDLTGKHLWVRQTLKAESEEGPTLEEMEIYYGTAGYGLFSAGGEVKNL